MQPIRQGDVYLIPASLPKNTDPVPREAGRVVLAHGEATGHAHAIADRTADLVRTANDERFLHIVGGIATLRHEEHGAIAIAPGTYRVVIGEEWSDAMEPVRVID